MALALRAIMLMRCSAQFAHRTNWLSSFSVDFPANGIICTPLIGRTGAPRAWLISLVVTFSGQVRLQIPLAQCLSICFVRGRSSFWSVGPPSNPLTDMFFDVGWNEYVVITTIKHYGVPRSAQRALFLIKKISYSCSSRGLVMVRQTY